MAFELSDRAKQLIPQARIVSFEAWGGATGQRRSPGSRQRTMASAI